MPKRGGQNGDKLILEQRDRLKRRIFDRKRAQTQVERVRLEHLQRCRRETCLEVDFQLGMIGLELAQDRRQQVHEHGHTRADAYPAEPSIAESAHHHLRARIFLQKIASMFDQLLAGFCQVGPLAETLHQATWKRRSSSWT